MKKDGRQARRRFGCRPEKSGGAGQGKRRQKSLHGAENAADETEKVPSAKSCGGHLIFENGRGREA
ncbi:hypothetical protein [Acidaminobacterium chupaoyuni]